jgi:hypothetical protein
MALRWSLPMPDYSDPEAGWAVWESRIGNVSPWQGMWQWKPALDRVSLFPERMVLDEDGC